MSIDAPAVPNNQGETNLFVEVASAEKQLWALIHSKGLLHTDVQDLYRKARTGYENIILNEYEVSELQDVEYCLWKLHYKHIDEYRKRIRQTSANAESTKSGTPQDVANERNTIDIHMEGFKNFLSEATEFYEDLITKIRKCCGLPKDPLSNKNGGSFSVEPTKFHKSQYACHRFLVCLGDLARYVELCKRTDIQNRKWSVAATYYLEAALIWPDSGNPQNQLALLATYVGDDFLALYHCVRSLAVREPFPDARDNLMLLFEKNISSHLHSLLCEAYFDFLKPSERSSSRTKSQASSGSSNENELERAEEVSSGNTDLWPLFIRMTSIFFLKSSLEDFPSSFASTLRELEALLSLDDAKLKASLESYEHMDSARRGPYRALQVVSILIFIVHSLTENPELKDPNKKNELQQSALTQWAWIATFICMGRFLERCLKGNHLDSCPLLVAVLVFVEWLVFMLDNAETYGSDEKVISAISYFFGAFGDLLNRLDIKEIEVKSQDHPALWEDYELRGFAPMGHAHELLYFSSHWEHTSNYDSGNVSRGHRILHAAKKIMDRSSGSRKWIFYDNFERKFYAGESIKCSEERETEVAKYSTNLEVKDPYRHKHVTTKGYEKDIPGENQARPCVHSESVAVEEEEVIIFKPITRHNSVPLYTSITTNDQVSTGGTSYQTASSDECLRRAASLFAAQNQAQLDPLNFSSNTTNFRSNKPLKQQEPLLKDSATYPVGPPSLSAWVVNRESLNIGREKGTRDFNKRELSPIEEIASESMTGLSKDSLVSSGHVSAKIHNSSPPYPSPVPSAPLLPDDASWFWGNSPNFSECNSAVEIKEANGILGAPPVSGYPNWSAAHGPLDFSPGIPRFMDGYPPLGMSSSEWLHQYTSNHTLERATNDVWPAQLNAPGNFHGHDASRFDLFDRWGNPVISNRMVYLDSPQLYPGSSLVCDPDEQIREKLFLGHQRLSPNGCGVGIGLRAEQPPLLQYLKEREWQLQRESQ